jgi:transposase InsO family protein
VEVALVEMRMAHPSWGPRRLSFELAKRGHVVSESAAYRALARLNLVDPSARRSRDRKWKRWERGAPMELWQMDVVGGFVLADGRRVKVLTGVDDHSRFCVSAHVMFRETSQKVCDGLAKALRSYGVPEQILTDNGKVFTGRFNIPPAEVLFDRVCRENGIRHLLTQPRSPTTTGKVERFHRAIRTEFRTDRTFTSRRWTWPPQLRGSSRTRKRPWPFCGCRRIDPPDQPRLAATATGSLAALRPSGWSA